jgi:hypothetical protein
MLRESQLTTEEVDKILSLVDAPAKEADLLLRNQNGAPGVSRLG